MDREEKQLEVAVDTLIQRTQDLKNSLSSFISRLENEYETMTWAQMIDSYALFSGHINNLMKIVRNDKIPPLKNRVLLPLKLSPDVDEELIRLTENRVQAFSAEMVPDYLRTKLDTEIEDKEKPINLKAGQLSSDQAQKQITMANKIVNNMIDLMKNIREEWETDSAKANQMQTSLQNDTNSLILAIATGKGLKQSTISPKGPPVMPMQQTPPQMPPIQGPRAGGPGKAPATIKTNIKQGSQANVHPYAR